MSDLNTPSSMMCGQGTSQPGTPLIASLTPYLVSIYWTDPYDNGGTDISSYTVEFTDLIAVSTTTFSVIDSNEFDFALSNGLKSGTQYEVRVYANNFITDTYPAVVSQWSAYLYFFTSTIVPVPPSLSASSIT